MILSVITATVFGAIGLYMVMSGRYAVTRRLSWIPFTVAAMELALCGALNIAAYPILSVILFACRITILVCCHRIVKRDAAMARNHQRRRAVWKHVAATAPEALVVLASPAQKRNCA